jgi:hypothetical protein
MRTTFRSKVDPKLKALGFAAPCIAILSLVTSEGLSNRLGWLPMTVTVLIAAMVVWVVLNTYYAFQGDALVVRSGPFSWRISLADIRAVRESNSLRSGPALSMDRLEITRRNGRAMLISPQDKAGFLAMLHRRAPHLSSP